MTQQHVWHQQCKVTPYAGAGSYTGGYYGSCYLDPQKQRERAWAANMRRWRESGVATIADRASFTSSVRAAGARNFRLVDKHGKAYGRRYTCTGESIGWSQMTAHAVLDQHGNQSWLEAEARVRIVNKQPEDLMSQASRIINSLHRQLKKAERQST